MPPRGLIMLPDGYSYTTFSTTTPMGTPSIYVSAHLSGMLRRHGYRCSSSPGGLQVQRYDGPAPGDGLPAEVRCEVADRFAGLEQTRQLREQVRRMPG